MKFSDRITAMECSPIRKLIPYANKAKEKGKKVYHLNIGQPDIATPRQFFDAVKNFNCEILTYSPSNGIPELIDAVIPYYRNYGMEFSKDDILVTNGGSEALLFTLMSLFDKGDDIVIPEPFYANYKSMFQVLEINVVPISTKVEEGFHLPSKAEIEKIITPKTKAILISNPGNPTGTAYTREEINTLASVAKEKGIFIISDEVYREFVYDNLDYASFGTIKDIEDNVIIIDSISKRYSACGARVGLIVSRNKEFMTNAFKLCEVRLSVAELEQIGAAALYKTPQNYLKEVNEEYKKRRDIVFEALSSMEGVVCRKPEGAFYYMVKLPVDNAEKFVIWLLEEFDVDGETLMMAPADGFYETEGRGIDEVRIAYILNESDLLKSMNILKEGLKKYPGRTTK
ncbi:aspartate aminotransferase [Clostridium carboxidivorans P7]|uniref:Aminotransferase n=1 Tax=Clostridium carboxidivorans P7 TaxID=536227 RepID=C6PRU7_9CLOT|nr:pyridoxal phosphate-dependent aminotransferase [Clostridium carboxidivorans]AKN30042.1 aspartate aminotransferase [Clostridium carboxidivorans P7]EET87999.1 aminotransferase class I and II [Clostridium carboxidivorans P7]EFG89047.1 aminotransferase, class I/II [Clostridium carboxidivorans P7]